MNSELLFLIVKYLKDSPLKQTFNQIINEINQLQSNGISLLPSRIDWLGQLHSQSFEELESFYKYIESDELTRVVYGEKKECILQSNSNLTRKKSKFQPIPLKLCTSQGHSNAIFSIIYDQTGNRIFTGGDDNLVKVWCADTGWLLHTIRAHQTITRNNTLYMIIDLDIDSDNTILVSSSSDKTIRVWDLKTFDPISYIHVGKEITGLMISPTTVAENKCLIVTCADSKTRVYPPDNIHNGFKNTPYVVDGGTLAKDEVDCCSFSLSGSKFITGGDDGLVYLYSLVDYSTMPLELQSIEPRLITCFDTHSAPLNDVSFSKDGRLFASGCKCGDLVIYTFNPLLEKYEWKKISVSQYSRKEKSQNDDTLGTFALNNVKYSVEITIIAWNADSSRVITVSSDFIPRVWDPIDASHCFSLIGHSEPIAFANCHPNDPRLMLTGGLDGQVFLWDIFTGKPIYSELKLIAGERLSEQLVSGAYNPNGNQFAVGDYRGSIHIFGVGYDQDVFNQIPEQQFHLLDWTRVREDSFGGLIDEDTQLPAHLVKMGELVSMQRISLNLPESYHYAKQKNFCNVNYLVKEYMFQRKLALQFEKVWMGKDVVPTTPKLDKKQLMQRRRLIRVENTRTPRNTPSLPEMPSDIFRGLPVPVSSGDEYSGVSDASEEEDEPIQNNRVVREASPLGNIIIDQDVFVDYSSEQNYEPARITTMRRNRHSLSEEETNGESDEFQGSDDEDEEIMLDDDFLDEIIANSISLLMLDDVHENVQLRSGRRLRTNSETDSVEFTPPRRRQKSDTRPKRQSKRISIISDSDETSLDELVQKKRRKIQKQVSEQVPVEPSEQIISVRYPPKWLTTTVPNWTPYLPQMNDLVVYVKEGHLHFAQKAANEYPFIVDETLPDLLLGKVLSIQYTPGPIVICTICLGVYPEFLPGDIPDENLSRIEISFADIPDCPDFLILWSEIEYAQKKCFQIGDSVIIRYPDSEYTGTVSQISEKPTPWEKYLVSFGNSNNLQSFSAWELRHENETFPEKQCVSEQDAQRIFNEIDEFISDPYMEPFVYEIPYSSFPDYLTFVAYPIHVLLIKQRLENNFYRHVKQIEWEWETMCQNAMKFNTTSSALYRLAKNTVLPYKYTLLNIPSPTKKPKQVLKHPVSPMTLEEIFGDSSSEEATYTRLRPRKPKSTRQNARRSTRIKNTSQHLSDEEFMYSSVESEDINSTSNDE